MANKAMPAKECAEVVVTAVQAERKRKRKRKSANPTKVNDDEVKETPAASEASTNENKASGKLVKKARNEPKMAESTEENASDAEIPVSIMLLLVVNTIDVNVCLII